MNSLRVSKILAVLALGAALAGCNHQRKGTTLAQKQLDPRDAKNFDVAAPWFCSMNDIEYSETKDGAETDGKTSVLATAATKADMLKALDAACAALSSSAAKSVCQTKAKAEDYRCVGASLFDREPAKTGLWGCKMAYVVAKKAQTLETSGKDTTSAAAIQSAFDQCAALKDDARSACAEGIMNEQLVCLDDNQVKAHKIRRLYK
ncbi:MAG: hypothetical protein JST04_01255 [Bdellovibrionales bacterium]|nr:hypothetical protein [Bdellovibrionales bacterium]